MDFPYLFSPIKINRMELKNRIVMTAMHLGYTPQGEVTDRLVDFYALRAQGGVGLIVVGGCPIDELGGMVGMIGLNDDRYIPGLQRLTRAVKDEGAKIAAQLYQAGRYTHSAMIGGDRPFSASAVRSRLTGETPRALDRDEIPEVQDRFARGAIRAQAAGFDAVEILASAGYLISQFLSSVTNLREDPYGGSLENRMRFGLEVVQKVRAAVGPDYPVILRIAGNEFMKGGNTNEEAKIFAAEAEKIGVDLFNVTGGWHETRIPQLTMSVPRGAYVYLAQGIKSAVKTPVLASNRINDPKVAEEVLRNGQADMVTMARGLLADPELPQKALNGNPERIYHCVACNQGCFDSIFRGKPATCLVNPRAGREAETRVEPADSPKTILVIGAGPAGMKTACIAAERGHRVIVVEKADRLGGQLLLNSLIPGRRELLTAVQDLEHNLKALEVEIRMGVNADMGLIKEVNPDTVVLASGARPVVPPIPGMDGPHVVQAWEVLAGRTGVGTRVVILGGNAVGLETALYLAGVGTLTPEMLHFLMANRAESMETLTELLNKGIKEVTVVEMDQKAGKDVGLTTKWTIMAELKRLGVKILTETKAVGVTPEGLETQGKNGKSLIPADCVVVAAGSRPENTLLSELQGVVPEILVIGDAQEPRNALTAIREGLEAGLSV
ncbi:MAG: FAD-dependent oxidoreductase [Thermodesulfobacteriota bacterium]